MKHARTPREKINTARTPTMHWGDGAFDGESRHKANGEGWGVPSHASTTTVKSADGHVNGLDRIAFQIPVKQFDRRYASHSVPFKPVACELQGPTVLGHGPHDMIRRSRRYFSL